MREICKGEHRVGRMSVWGKRVHGERDIYG